MEYRLSEGILIIEPGEEIDHHQTEIIIRYTEGVIRQRRVNAIIFDLADTTFMDSAGVGMLIGLYREMKGRGGTIGILHMSKSIRRIYQMAGLQRIIQCYEDEEQMMAVMGGGNTDER